MIWEKWQQTLEPLRELLNKALKKKWEEWEIPREPDGGWSQQAEAGSGRTDLHVTIDTTGRTHDRREDFAEVYGDWDEIAERTGLPAPAQSPRPAGSGAPAQPARPGAPAVLSAG